MKASYKLVFNRKGRLKEDGTALIQLRVYIQKKQKYYSTGIYVKPHQWDPVDRKIKVHPKRIKFNKQLRDMVSDLEDYEIKILEDGKEFGFGHVEQCLAGSSEVEFIQFCRNTLEENKKIKYSTYRAVRSKLNVLEKWGVITTYADLTYENILKLDNWLRGEGKGDQTIFKYHSVLKTYIGHAVNMDLMSIQNNPYLRFKPKYPAQAKRRYLDGAEVKRIDEKEFSTDRLRQVRDVFMFSVYTGLSYADICDLKPVDIYVDTDGYSWIWRDRMKVQTEYKVPLLPQAAKIIEKYKNGRSLLPVSTNQKMNEYLKEIATLCEVEKNLTFHMARHTFATTITLTNDVPIETVSKMLGHRSLKTTQIYAKIVDSKMKNDMQELRKKIGAGK